MEGLGDLDGKSLLGVKQGVHGTACTSSRSTALPGTYIADEKILPVDISCYERYDLPIYLINQLHIHVMKYQQINRVQLCYVLVILFGMTPPSF